MVPNPCLRESPCKIRVFLRSPSMHGTSRKTSRPSLFREPPLEIQQHGKMVAVATPVNRALISAERTEAAVGLIRFAHERERHKGTLPIRRAETGASIQQGGTDQDVVESFPHATIAVRPFRPFRRLGRKGRFVQKGDNIILVDGENSGEVFAVPCDGYMGSTFKQLWVSSVMHLPYVLNFILFYKELLRKCKRGAAIPHLNKEVFYSLIIGIPPYQEQMRIVNKINEIYSKIKA